MFTSWLVLQAQEPVPVLELVPAALAAVLQQEPEPLEPVQASGVPVSSRSR